MTRDQIGDLYVQQGGVLSRRFLGSTLWIAQQIKQGGIANPTQAQSAWSAAVVAATDVVPFANAALKWGLVNNTTLQDSGNGTSDGDLDYIVAEAAKAFSS